MISDDIEVGVSDAERQVQETVHSFAETVLRPAGTALDRLQDPADVIAPDSVLWEVVDKYSSLGLDVLSSPDGGLDALHRARLSSAVQEEMSWGDAGLTIVCGLTQFIQPLLAFVDDQELADRFGTPGRHTIGCWAQTEPDHGSDSIAFTEGHFSDASVRPNCVATRDGGDYVIQGQKAAWVSCGSIAAVALVNCTIETGRGFAGGGSFVVPLDLPGVQRGRPLDKLGQRSLNQGEIFFEGVRVPARWMLAGPDAYPGFLELLLSHGNAAIATIFVGVAQAAYDHALAYAHERVQGGAPIARHQGVRSRLFEMFMKVSAARAMARRVAAYNAVEGPKFQHCAAAKVYVTSTAEEVAGAACQIFGGNGITKEYPVEKLLRDARTSLVEDGCNEMLGIMAGARLTP